MNFGPLPEGYTATREGLHQIAFFAVSPARYAAVGRMGLRATSGGFGTPEFEGRVDRVEGGVLVHSQDENVATQTITTIRAAAEFFGVGYVVEWFGDFHDPPQPVDPDVDLRIEEPAALTIGEWFSFGTEVLERLRSHGTDDDDVSEVQLWPEHFDLATELGSQDRGERASFGASPGDGANREPYFYVAPWGEIDRSSDFWNEESFNGASLKYSTLRDAVDPVDAAVEFLLRGYGLLHMS